MNLQRSKRWLLCVSGAFLICLGLYLWHWSPVLAKTGVLATTAVAIDDTAWETDWPTTRPPVAEDTVESVEVDDTGADGAQRDNRAIRYWALGAMILGAVLAVWYFRCKGSCCRYLCPETELLLVAAAAAATVFLLWSWRVPWLVGAGTVTGAGALAALRSFLRRLAGGLRLADTGASRLGRRTGSARGFGAVQLILTVLCLACGAAISVVFPWAGVPLALYAAVPAACLLVFCRDMDRLTGQIRRLHQGQPVEHGKGYFSGDGETLGDLQRQRDEAVQTALTSERFKVELISNVSHDLRTPLTAILGYGELLEQETLTAQGRERLTLLNRKAGYMRDLVEELFELTKVSSGSVEAEWKEIDLLRLLEQTLGLLDDKLRETGLEVRRYYPDGTLPLVTDGSRMHQVFMNLLENAIKYALPGTRIYLEVRKGEGQVTVRLTNTASYDMDFQPEEIVQRFARGDKARTTQGSGIGLAIAQTYTESCGGEFRVEVDGDQFRAIVTLPEGKTERIS